MVELSGLPGAERVERGLRDWADGRWSDEALLLAAACTRLRELELPMAEDRDVPDEPELALYASLCRHSDDPYGRYNALRSELDSFIACLEARRRRTVRGDLEGGRAQTCGRPRALRA